MKQKIFVTALSFFLIFSVVLLNGGCVPKNEAEDHFQNAVEFMELQMFNEAIIELKNGMRLTEKTSAFDARPEKSLVEALVLLSDGKNDLAERVLEQAIAKHENYWSYRLLLGSVYLQQKNYKKAIKVFKEVPVLEFNYGQLYFVEGLDCLQSKQFDKAIDRFKQARLQFERESLNFNEKSGAQQYVENNAKALMLYSLGQAYFETGKYPDSLNCFSQVKELAPQFPNLDSDINIIKFKIQLAEQPGNAALLNNIGLAYLARRQYDKAQSSFEQALRSSPTLGMANNNLGLLFYEKGDYTKASYYFRIARSAPDLVARSLALFNLGRISRREGKIKEALSHLEAAVKLNPSFEPAKKEYDIAACLMLADKDASISEQLGNLYFANKEFNNALRVYEKVSSAPKRFVLLSRVYLEEKNYEKAKEYSHLAIKKNPKLGQAYYILGLTLRSQGKQLAAVNALRLAIEYSNTDRIVEAQDVLAATYFELGDSRKAINIWQEIKDRNDLSGERRALVKKIVEIIS